MEKKTVKVTLVKSPIGCKKAHRQTVLGLGLKKIRQTRERADRGDDACLCRCLSR
jgi:large subunit ribosomal protein L30